MGTIDKESIGVRQQMIMQCIWAAGGYVTIQEIADRLKAMCGQEFSKASINSLVLLLVDRGFLGKGPKVHQAFTFYALISEEEFRVQEIKRFGKLTFGNSASMMLASLLQTDVSEEEYQKMKELIENYHG